MSSAERGGRGAETAARPPIAPPGLAPSSVAATVAERLSMRQPVGDRFWRDARRRRMLALADMGAGAIASLLIAGSTARMMWALALLPAWVLLAKLFGLYDRDQRSIRHRTADELSTIAAWVAAGVVMVGLVLPLTPGGAVSLGVMAAAWLAVTIVAAL